MESNKNLAFNNVNAVPFELSPFSKEHMKILHKLLSQPQQSSLIGTCFVAQKGNFQSALNGKMEKTSPWIIDSRASYHMTGDPNLFNQYSPCTGNFSIRIADGSLSKITGTGYVII